jgi:hypothetical protein
LPGSWFFFHNFIRALLLFPILFDYYFLIILIWLFFIFRKLVFICADLIRTDQQRSPRAVLRWRGRVHPPGL